MFTGLDLQEIKSEVAKIGWFHSFDFGNGIVTHGYDDSPLKLKTLGMPEDLQGITVLDIGAWDGYFSFEAERRGAKRVLATDSFVWSGTGHTSKDGFDLAKKILKSKVQEKKIDVLEISPENVGDFDLVLFLGVLYHMKHPLLALEKVSSVTSDMLILETMTDLQFINRPAMAFYPEGELEGDLSNWFGLNHHAIEAMLKLVGFKRIKVIHETATIFRTLGKKGPNPEVPLYKKIPITRIVYHAWK